MRLANRAVMRTQILVTAIVAALASPAFAQSAPDKRTERTWKAKCSSCHGPDGKGQTEQGKKMGGLPDLSAAAWQDKATDDKIRQQILNGVKKTENGTVKEMKPFKDELKPPEVDALIAFVRQLRK
jgi:mono/diheme cytochrome c family protein